MQRSAYQRIAAVLACVLVLGLTACADEGVGDPCIPEKIPCDPQKGCGYDPSESYIEASSVQCRSRLCIVHHLEGASATSVADPSKVQGETCGQNDKNCVTPEQLDDAVYCTCKCGGPKTSLEFCECPSGFECTQIIQEGLGGVGVQGKYCVHTAPAAE